MVRVVPMGSRQLVAAVVGSVLSLRWLPFCSLGWHELHSVTEVWGSAAVVCSVRSNVGGGSVTLAESKPVERLTTGPEDVAHWYCCNPDVSLCGLDLGGCEDVDPGPAPADCALCADVYASDQPCAAEGCPVGRESRARWFA
jgi:hypothetical protein